MLFCEWVHYSVKPEVNVFFMIIYFISGNVIEGDWEKREEERECDKEKKRESEEGGRGYNGMKSRGSIDMYLF